METSTEYPTRTVRDYLFVFDTVKAQTFTVDPATELVTEHEDRFEFLSPSGERSTFYKSKMAMFSVRDRQEVVYPPGESPAEKEILRLTKEAEVRAARMSRRRSLYRTQPREGAEV